MWTMPNTNLILVSFFLTISKVGRVNPASRLVGEAQSSRLTYLGPLELSTSERGRNEHRLFSGKFQSTLENSLAFSPHAGHSGSSGSSFLNPRKLRAVVSTVCVADHSSTAQSCPCSHRVTSLVKGGGPSIGEGPNMRGAQLQQTSLENSRLRANTSSQTPHTD